MVSKTDFYNISVSEERHRLFIAGRVYFDEGVVVLITGKLEVVRVPFSWFTPTNIAPNFKDFDIIDCGQTVRLGYYEASTEAVLKDFLPHLVRQDIRKDKP